MGRRAVDMFDQPRCSGAAGAQLVYYPDRLKVK